MVISALIIAQKESKRLKNKNWRFYKGKPMFQHNLEKCLMVFDKVYVSSDSEYILNITEKLGAIPIKRSKELTGNIPNIDVYKHALKFMKPDAIVAVQANSPDIDIDLIEEAKYLMERGYEEIKTCHKDKSDYGSIWGITVNKIKNYPDSYYANPDIWLVDESKDIHTIKDICQ